MKSKVKILTHLGAGLGLFAMLSGSAQAIIIDQFTNESSWISNVGSYTVEDFEDDVLAYPLQSITGDDVVISGGVLNDVIDQNSLQDTTFTFNPGVYGIGGTWDLFGPSGPGTEIVLRTSSGIYSLGLIPNATENTFWGFTIDEALLDIYLVEGPLSTIYPDGIETYTLDNLLMAESLASSVPEPGTLAMIGIGLVGIGFSRRKRNTAI